MTRTVDYTAALDLSPVQRADYRQRLISAVEHFRVRAECVDFTDAERQDYRNKGIGVALALGWLDEYR